MENDASWQFNIEEALLKKAEQLSTRNLEKLREQFGIYQTYYENVYNIFLRKSLILVDPYKYDEKLAEVKTPSLEGFIDTEKLDQMSQRLSAFHSQLEFLNTYYQFSLDFLNIGRIKRIVSLIKYVHWAALESNASNIVSRTISEYINRIKRGTDKISSQIIVDSVSQLAKTVKTISGVLAELANFHKESYKIEVRKHIINNMSEKLDFANGIKTIKRLFPKQLPDYSFYPDLIKEILTEELAPEGPELKEKILQKMLVKIDKKEKEKKETSHKGALFQAIRYLAASGFQIEDIVGKLTDNNIVYQSRKVSFSERLKRWLKKVFSNADDTQNYEIEYFDVVTSSTKSEKIRFSAFLEEIQRKAKFFISISNRSSVAMNRLKEATEEKLFDFLKRNISSLNIAHRRIVGLIEFFVSEVTKDKRHKLRGVKLELSAIKNSIIKANQQKHEYVAKKEEQEQMKRLGIKQD